MPHLVEWDSLDLRLRGERILEIVRAQMAKQRAPVSGFMLEFVEGQANVSGQAQVIFAVPFRFVVRRVIVEKGVAYIRLEEMSAFGFLPVPKLLMQIFGGKGLPEGISIIGDGSVVAARLDRFLPPFVDVAVESVTFVAGGVRVHLGPGGADPPVEVPAC